MRTSQNGINLIKQFEGCRLKAYKCAAGVPTIGYGHTAGVYMGQTITQTQAESFLKDDLLKYEKLVLKYNSKYNWNQNEFDALVSFCYNIGSIDGLTSKGTRTKKEIANKILAYNKAKGKVLAGLSQRRKKENALFLTPESDGSKTTTKDSATKTENTTTASNSSTHIQLNYKAGNKYTISASALTVRTKPRLSSGKVVKGSKLRSLTKGTTITNKATMALNKEIWMYIGTKNGKEEWICADTGTETYVK